MTSKTNLLFFLAIFSSTLVGMKTPPIKIDEQEYALFKTVQKIRAIAGQTRKEINRVITMKDRRKIDYSPPYSSSPQTKQGLLLLADENPNELITPWGKIQILPDVSYASSTSEAIAAFQLFFYRVKASIDAFSMFPNSYAEIVQPIDVKILFASISASRKIPDEEVHSYIGKRALVVSSRCGMLTRYMIEQVDAETVPAVEFYDNVSECRSEETVKTTWKAMQQRHDKEKAEFNNQFFTSPTKNPMLYLSKLPAEILQEIGKFYND